MRKLAALLVVLLLVAVPRAAHATLGMCTLVGTVYNVDGTVAKNGVVNFRLPTTQTFSADSVQTSLEHVVLDSGGNLPAGTQVPLGARIFIQVGSDKPVSVVVTTNPANCPLAFGTLVGSGAGGVPIPSTVITSITTVNNIPGITDTVVNPPGAGPATLTLSDGYPITFGSSSSAADLSGSGLSPLFTQVGNSTNGTVLQDETSATAFNTDLGQMAWGSTGTAATDKRAVVLAPRLNAASATNSTGRLDFYLADGSGNPLGTVGTMLQLFDPSQATVGKFIGNKNNNTTLILSNTTSGTAAQSFFQAASSAGNTFLGTRSAGWTGGDVPADYGFVEADAGTNGLYLVSDSAHTDEGIHFAANGQIANGNLQMTEDASANFFLTMPALVQFVRNVNAAAEVQVSNTSATANAQAELEVANANGLIGQFSATGASSTFGAPYTANMPYLQSTTSAGLLEYATAGALHLAASGQGAHGTLDVTEDASDNFFFANSVGTALTRFTGGNPTMQIISTTNATNDILEVYPQNITWGQATWYGGFRTIGSNGNNPMELDAQGSGEIQLNPNNPTDSGTWSYSSLGTVNNHHLFSSLNSGSAPGFVSCNSGGTATISGGSTDSAGQLITSNTSGISTCTINFGATWGTAPLGCVCSMVQIANGIPLSCFPSVSTTQMVFKFTQQSIQSAVNWVCIGNANDAGG